MLPAITLPAPTRQGISAAVIQDFEISITAVGDDQYLIRTEKVAKGVQLAEEKVRWPVAEWLEKTQSFMHDPLLEILQGQQRHSRTSKHPHNTTQHALAHDVLSATSTEAHVATTEADTLVHLGQTLHNALFQGQLHDSWVTAQGIAHNRQNLLRLRIGMKDSRLQQLPWEALHAGTRPLATGTDVIFSRYILDRRQGHSVQLNEHKDAKKTLKILMVIASPDDQERLELKQEVEHLRSELHPTGAESTDLNRVEAEDASLDIQLTLLEQPGRAELTQALDRGDYHVLHYAGHSDLGNAGGDLYLVSRQTGLTEPLSGEDLAGLLVNNGIRLAVFNSCRGGYSPSGEQGWQERNLAQALINRGMPSVIAMAERIPDDVAITFTQLLYRNLKKGQAIDLSVNRTRQGLISAFGSHQFYWALPTLYMQPSFNGYLLETDGNHEQAERLGAIPALGDIFRPGSDSGPSSGSSAQLTPSKEAIQSSSVHRSNYQHDRANSAASANSATNGQTGNPAASALEAHTIQPQNMKPQDMKPQKLVDNNDPTLANTMVQKLEVPPNTVDVETEIDGELRVPEDLKTPRGFYGEPTVVDSPPTQTEEQTTDHTDSAQIPAKQKPQGSTEDEHPPSNRSTQTTKPAAPSEELIGERLTRSHTLHTKILTTSGLASMAAAILLGVFGVLFVQRISVPDAAGPETRSGTGNEISQNELGLPAQIEVALLQENIDAATTPAKTLIESGELSAVLAALETANSRQQQDVIIAFFRGRAQWGLVKQGSIDFAADDAMRSWKTALEGESDWMEIAMALGFAQYAIGREQEALDSWEQAIALAERQSDAQIIYFSEKSKADYMLNAYAGLAMVSLALSKIEVNPSQRNLLLDRAISAYQKVMNDAPADFSPKALGSNWLWLSPAIADWVDTKQELSQLVE
ncbi:MAG: CHAT domain-containing protein [Cyanobacteria bacterium P01_D01_bin.105]